MPDRLSLRALNRAVLARQMLLAREEASPLRVIERLFGLQAQEARPPFVGLWTRIQDFRSDDLIRVLHDREAVKVTAMRGTLHLMSAQDFLSFRATLQPMLTAGMRSILKERLANLDIDALLARARSHLEQGSLTFDLLRARLAAEDPDADPRVLGYVVRMTLPLVVEPDTSIWGFSARAGFTPADAWLGRPPEPEERRRELVRRYLAAFGPATCADMQAWSGMTGLAAVFDSLVPELLRFRDERRRELFDLPDAPRPDEETPAPVRFLPDFDNVVLAYADRSRIVSDAYRKRIVTPNLRVPALFLVDGFVAGTWTVELARKTAALSISPFEELALETRDELAEEGVRLVRFIARDAGSHSVRFT